MIPGGMGGSEIYCPSTDKNDFEGGHGDRVNWLGLKLSLRRRGPYGAASHRPGPKRLRRSIKRGTTTV
jgi:hypothetical protein